MKKTLLILLLPVWVASCNQKEKVDLLLYNATIYTVDSSFSIANAIAIKDGKIVATGTTDELQAKFEATSAIDESGKFIYPGFIDAHAHFVGYAGNLARVNLVDTKSWEDVLDRTKHLPPLIPLDGSPEEDGIRTTGQ